MVLCSVEGDLFHLYRERGFRVELDSHDDGVQADLWDGRCVVVSSGFPRSFHRRGESDARAFSDRKSFW